MRKLLKPLIFGSMVVILAMAAGPLMRVAFDSSVRAQDWRTARNDPAGYAPDPTEHEPAVVQAYAAATVRWRGAFGDHCWIAVKDAGGSHYRRYEVIGWNLRRNRSTVTESETANPDRAWYGARPKLLQDIRGAEAEAIIAQLPAAVASYPHANEYRMWPGPNSNTFIAHIAREVPEFRLAMPGRAIGKDYLLGGNIVARAPSGTGFQFSVFGVLGVMLAVEEGIEVNILGLVVGADPGDLAITLPGFGRLSPLPNRPGD
jgi:hypothetical protein